MKRFISIFLLLILVFNICSQTAFANSIMIAEPTVFISGENQYNIVWVTDSASVGAVELTYGGKKHTYYDERDGIIRTDDSIHTVRVPKSALDSAKSYTVVTKEVLSSDKYGIEYGGALKKNYKFYPYSNQKKIKFGIFSDLHTKIAEFDNLDLALDIAKNKIGKADVIVLNGDIVDALPDDTYFTETLLYVSRILSNGTVPVLYIRGNHECHGEWAQYLSNYLAFDSGELYGKFSYGPISALVADCGDDKPDYQQEYGGLLDFEDYMLEQYCWFENMGGYQSDAQYKIALSHSPRIFNRGPISEITNLFADYGTDIAVGGHYHNAQLYSEYAQFPTVTDGGIADNNGYSAACMVFENGKISFDVYDKSYKNVLSFKTDAGKLDVSEHKNYTPEHEQKLHPQTVIATEGDESFITMLTHPTVFDCGDNYNIVYAVDATSELSLAQAVILKDGKTYTFTDSVGGNARSGSVHSISVPKSILEGSQYYVKTTYLGAYGAYGTNLKYEGISTEIEATVVSKTYSFKSFKNKKDLNIAQLSANGGLKDAVAFKNSTTINPDVIVVRGASNGLYSQSDFINNVLKFTSAVSSSSVPVIFCRGEGESYGDYASNIGNILGNLYFTTKYGDVTLVVCDTVSSASNNYIQAQKGWVNTLKIKNSNCVLAVASNTELAKEILGQNYTELGIAKVLDTQNGVVAYKNTTLIDYKNTFAGTTKHGLQKIETSILKVRLDTKKLSTAPIRQDAEPNTKLFKDYTYVLTNKNGGKFYEHTLYEWQEKGFDTYYTKTEMSPAVCSKLIAALANLYGIDFDKVKGDNNNIKAIDLFYSLGVTNFAPPVLHEFGKDDVKTIVDNLLK